MSQDMLKGLKRPTGENPYPFNITTFAPPPDVLPFNMGASYYSELGPSEEKQRFLDVAFIHTQGQPEAVGELLILRYGGEAVPAGFISRRSLIRLQLPLR